MKISQAQQAQTLMAAMHALDERAAEIARAVDQAAFDWQPPEGGWSAGQVFEHLCVANDSYLMVLRPLLERRSRTQGRDPADAAWRPTFAGRLLARSMESPRKLRAPKMWRPAPAPRSNVIAEFLTRQREIEALIERSLTVEWQHVRLASPVSSLIRMNIGDAFTILVLHAERHFRQIDGRLAAYAESIGGHVVAGR